MRTKSKLILVALLIVFFTGGMAFAMSLTSSGEVTSSSAVVAQKCLFGGILILTDGTNDATIIAYDNASAASGDKIWEAKITGVDNYGGGILPHPIRCTNGIYVTVSGTGASCIVFYSLK